MNTVIHVTVARTSGSDASKHWINMWNTMPQLTSQKRHC